MSECPSVSIIICTANRADYLRQTLSSMAEVCVPEGSGCELLVVDNASTDHTKQVVQEAHLPQMTVRYLHEPRRGQCHARNAGLAAAAGKVILFTDDDVRPPVHWISGMTGPILSGEADAVTGGVRLAPHLLRPWMGVENRTWLASTESVSPEKPERMVGANMAFSRRVLDRVPQFDTDLGPGALGFYDETLFSAQLLAVGFRLVSALDVCVEHHPDPSRLSRESYHSSAEKMGMSQAHMIYHWEHQSVKAPQRRLVQSWLELMLWRAKHRQEWKSSEGMAEKEMSLLRHRAFLKRFLREQRTPRKYDKHGLTLRHRP